MQRRRIGLDGAFELKPGEDAETAMARADEAMYANKRNIPLRR